MSTEVRDQLSHAARLVLRRSHLLPLTRRLRGDRRPLAAAIRLGERRGWTEAARWLLGPEGRRELTDPDLLERLSRSIQNLIELDFILTELRRLLLVEQREALRHSEVQTFVLALIRQCINNEYVFYVSEEEQAILDSFDASAVRSDSLSEDQIHMLIVRALYRPIPEVFAVDAVEDGVLAQLPPAFAELVSGILAEHADLEKAVAEVETAHSIEGAHSRKTAAWYEKFPYPRWVDIHNPPPGSRRGFLRQFYSDDELAFIDKPFSVLVAGCGTGRKAIQLAVSFGADASVLGTDLSRSSLGYSIMMTRRLGVTNLRFLQADILDLARLGMKFDIVECTGVLHHMADPEEGWRQLTDVTRPGGLQHVALYSEASRRILWQLREEAGFVVGRDQADADFIRRYRRELFSTKADLIDGEFFPIRYDLFDVSRFKDLIFPDSEQCFDVPRIARAVEQLGLEFRGFQTPRPVPDRLWAVPPKGPDIANLDAWHEFESKAPSVFGDMYEAWFLKPSDS